jgi:hypothetical protein
VQKSSKVFRNGQLPRNVFLKEQSHDFFKSVFFIKVILLAPLDMPRNKFYS